ncbi:MAG: S-methyl-5-thioribose-1-phosphate isomerase [Synergistaceae bacterium]
MLPSTLDWNTKEKTLKCFDQRSIPFKNTEVVCVTYKDVAEAIENMTVRGAPAIGSAAAYGVVLAAYRDIDDIESAISALSNSRPTAVNLSWALKRMKVIIEKFGKDNINLPNILEKEAIKIQNLDVLINKTLSEYGQKILPNKATVITHCNAGAIATCGYGTALGILRAARENSKEIKLYADETRPRLQGGKITAYEMHEDMFDVTVITDSMAAYLMSKKKIDAVITGADRVAMNGDTANKIGTYSLAVVAKHHGVPFYIAAPRSTFDINCIDGNEIPIEERDGDEIRVIANQRIIPKEIKVWNPSFDVTPNSLITGIITEYGILKAPYSKVIPKIFELPSLDKIIKE